MAGVQHKEQPPQLLAAVSATKQNFRNGPYLSGFWVNFSEPKAELIAFISD